MTIHIVLGTKAQLVKMAPVMVRLTERGIPYRFIHTGQHQATMSEMLEEFELEQPDVVLYSGRDIVSLPQMALWLLRILFQCLVSRKRVFGEDARGIVLVHGDTFSTLLGALMGRVARLRVGHVESGLRSFDVFHPFPEEITRLLRAHARWGSQAPEEFDDVMSGLASSRQNLTRLLAETMVRLDAMPPPEERARQLAELAADIEPWLDHKDVKRANAWLAQSVRAIWCADSDVLEVELV